MYLIVQCYEYIIPHVHMCIMHYRHRRKGQSGHNNNNNDTFDFQAPQSAQRHFTVVHINQIKKIKS